MRPLRERFLIDINATLLDDIRTLLARSNGAAPRPSLAEIEDTLTTGYAQALALEAERWRLERRVGEVAARIAAGGSADGDPEELAKLARRMSATDEDLGVLRLALRDLRDRASALRSAGGSLRVPNASPPSLSRGAG